MRGGGTINVRGVRADGKWTYSVLRLAPNDGSAPIDLGIRN